VPASPALHRRRRLLASSAALVLIALVIALPIVLFGSGGPTPPATGAASVVPADALAYVHLSTDESRASGHAGGRARPAPAGVLLAFELGDRAP